MEEILGRGEVSGVETEVSVGWCALVVAGHSEVVLSPSSFSSCWS